MAVYKTPQSASLTAPLIGEPCFSLPYQGRWPAGPEGLLFDDLDHSVP